MADQYPPGFRFAPDPTVTTASRAATGAEFVATDKQAGSFTVNKWLVKPLRSLMPKVAGRILGPPDMSGVWTADEPSVGPGMKIVRPRNVTGKGALLLIHGGGYVLGAPGDMLGKAAMFAKQAGITVFCPGYRLGPEHPFPAGLDDCHGAWTWLLEHAAEFDVDPSRIVIGGYSAGGGLAAALVQRIHDGGGPRPSAQLLVYPMLDDATATKRELDKPRHRVWSNANNLFGWTGYLGRDPGGDALPYAVPSQRSDLSGLPPAWIGVGTSDLFLDEDREYAKRLTEAGVDVTYVEVDGGIHGFDNTADSPLADAFNASTVEFAKTHTA